MVAPLFGKIRQERHLAEIASSLSLLLYSGMPLKSGLGIVKENISNRFYAAKIAKIETQLQAGQSFSLSSRQNEIFDAAGHSLLQAGEKTGSLDEMLNAVSSIHQERLGDRVDFMTSLIEPIMMVMIGAIIGIIVIAVYLPIFGVTNVVQ